MAGVQLAIFLVISFSSCSHLNFLVNSPIITDTADATNSDTWLAPSSVALPNTVTQHVMSAMRTKIGINDMG